VVADQNNATGRPSAEFEETARSGVSPAPVHKNIPDVFQPDDRVLGSRLPCYDSIQLQVLAVANLEGGSLVNIDLHVMQFETLNAFAAKTDLRRGRHVRNPQLLDGHFRQPKNLRR